MDQIDLTILIPTLNEEKNIGRLIDRISALIPNVEIIVVDDGSTDETQKIVKSKSEIKLIDRSNEDIKGLSASIKSGLLTVKTNYFMVIDGDFQHPPDALLEAITCMKNDPDLVIGYRIKVENWPFFRKLMSWGAQQLAYISLLFRRKPRPKDMMSGFFGGKTTFIQDILTENKIALKGYKILFDILKAVPRSIQICQFGYVFKNRQYGDSKIGKKQIWEFFKSLF